MASFRGLSGSLGDDGVLGKRSFCGGGDVRDGRLKSASLIGGVGEMLLCCSGCFCSCSEAVVTLGIVSCGQSPLARSVLFVSFPLVTAGT